MMDEILNELRKLDKRQFNDDFLIIGREYIPLKIEEKNFKHIPEKIHSNKFFDKYVITFIDGGQAVLFESAFFCLGYIRTAAVTYENNSRKSIDIKNFYILIKEVNNSFYIKTFPKTSFESIIFNRNDSSLDKEISCSKILPIIRRFAELEHASKFDRVLIDGTFEAKYSYELDYIKNLKAAYAFSKTCSLVTNNGFAVIDVLRDINDKSWYYYPIVINNNKNHPAEIFFVKLSEKSDYVFRMELKINSDVKNKHILLDRDFENSINNCEYLLGNILMSDFLDLLYFLKNNSKDPIFLGYPYGLIDADSHARVTDQERKILQTKISVMMGKDWKNFSKTLKSMNAHEILDNIKF